MKILVIMSVNSRTQALSLSRNARERESVMLRDTERELEQKKRVKCFCLVKGSVTPRLNIYEWKNKLSSAWS